MCSCDPRDVWPITVLYTVKTGVLTEQGVLSWWCVIPTSVCYCYLHTCYNVLVPVLLVFFNTSRHVVMWKKSLRRKTTYMHPWDSNSGRLVLLMLHCTVTPTYHSCANWLYFVVLLFNTSAGHSPRWVFLRLRCAQRWPGLTMACSFPFYAGTILHRGFASRVPSFFEAQISRIATSDQPVRSYQWRWSASQTWFRPRLLLAGTLSWTWTVVSCCPCVA